MRVVVHHAAEEELFDAVAWYENEQPGLGENLLREALRVQASIAEAPLSWPLLRSRSSVRRFVFSRFPYIAYYVVRRNDVLILAFAHTKRSAGYWQKRHRP